MNPIKSIVVSCAVLLALTGCSTPLMKAAEDGDIKAATSLLDKGVDVNETSGPNTALFWAVVKNHPNMVKFLLERGADAKLMGGGDENRTMSWAHYSKNPEIVKMIQDALAGKRPMTAGENIIFMNDGSEIRGEIVNQNRTSITVKTKYATMTIEKKNIKEIKYK